MKVENLRWKLALMMLATVLILQGASLEVASTGSPTGSSPNKAERITVSGKVTDKKGEECIGATVMVKGTTWGTACDVYGNFTIEAPSDGVLEISYVGFATKKVKILGRTNLGQIKLIEK